MCCCAAFPPSVLSHLRNDNTAITTLPFKVAESTCRRRARRKERHTSNTRRLVAIPAARSKLRLRGAGGTRLPDKKKCVVCAFREINGPTGPETRRGAIARAADASRRFAAFRANSSGRGASWMESRRMHGVRPNGIPCVRVSPLSLASRARREIYKKSTRARSVLRSRSIRIRIRAVRLSRNAQPRALGGQRVRRTCLPFRDENDVAVVEARRSRLVDRTRRGGRATSALPGSAALSAKFHGRRIPRENPPSSSSS